MDAETDAQPTAEELARYVATLPQLIGMEITQRCNLQCPMCHVHARALHSQFSGADMRIDAVDKLGPFLATAGEVWLTGGGEPLLVAGLPDFVDRCRQYNPNIRVKLISNGVLLTDRKMQMLIQKKVTSIDFSLDGTIQYGHVGGGADFEQTKGNLRRLASLKQQCGVLEPKIGIAFVAMRDNLVELPGIIDFAAEIGAEIWFQPISPASAEQRNQNVYRHVAYTRRLLDSCADKARAVGVEFHPFNFEPDLSQAPRGGCIQPNTQLWVSYAGQLHACCGGIATSHNIYEPGLNVAEVWNSPFLLRLRWELASGHYNDTCRRCPALWNTIENQERAIPLLEGNPPELDAPSASERGSRLSDRQRIQDLERHVTELEAHIAAIYRGRVWQLMMRANRVLGRA